MTYAKRSEQGSYDFAPYLRQIELETDMLTLGYDRTEQRITRLRDKGEASRSPLGIRLTRTILPDLTAAFTRFTATANPGPKAPAREILRHIPPDAIAYLTARGVFDAVGSKEYSESDVAAKIGADLMEQLRGDDLGRDAALYVGAAALHVWQLTTADEYTRARATFNGPNYLHGTTKMDDLLREEPEEYLLPRFMPCVVEPAPWTVTPSQGLRGGYYHEGLRQRLAMVKHQPRNYLEDFGHTEQPAVLTAVNAVQATGWRINRPIFDVLRPMTKSSRKDPVHRALVIAKRYLKDEAIYFPMTLDLTGRLYPVPVDLHPYGSDEIKALLTFSHGKPLGTQAAADALAVHGANVFGAKGPLAQRIEWVRDHEQEILDIAGNRGPWWFVASNPWQFLAFCFEWAGYLREGLGFVSSLPVVADGSCNGLQHFSAMLRDEIGGAAVNLIPMDEPQDIYQAVADKVNATMGTTWVTRHTVKKCVMNVPYGMTRHGRWEALREWARDEGEEVDVVEVEQHVAAAIETTVVKAVEVMKWLRDAVSAADLPLVWQTPSGFPAMQWEIEQKSVDVHSVVNGQRKRFPFKVNAADGRQNRKAARAGIAPNFVHSMDAAHLHLTVAAAVRAGLTSFAMEHDGYGTVAADAPKLAVILRQAFVDMYQRHDVLADFEASLSKPAGYHVERGKLDIRQVWDSKYFFA